MSDDPSVPAESGDWSRWILGDESDHARMILPLTFLRDSGLSFSDASEIAKAIETLPSESVLYIAAAIDAGKVDVNPPEFALLDERIRATLLSLSTTALRDLAWGRRNIEQYVRGKIAATVPAGFCGDSGDWSRLILTLTFIVTPGIQTSYAAADALPAATAIEFLAQIDAGTFPDKSSPCFAQLSRNLHTAVLGISRWDCPTIANRRRRIDSLMRKMFAENRTGAESFGAAGTWSRWIGADASDWARWTLMLVFVDDYHFLNSSERTIEAIGSLQSEAVVYLAEAIRACRFDESAPYFASLSPWLQSRMRSLSKADLVQIGASRRYLVNFLRGKIGAETDNPPFEDTVAYRSFGDHGVWPRWVFGSASEWARKTLALAFLLFSDQNIGVKREIVRAIETLPSVSVLRLTDSIDSGKLDPSSPAFTHLEPKIQSALLGSANELPMLAWGRHSIIDVLRGQFSALMNEYGEEPDLAFQIVGDETEWFRKTLSLALLGPPFRSELAKAIGNLSDAGVTYVAAAIEAGTFDTAAPDFAQLGIELQSALRGLSKSALHDLSERRKKIEIEIRERLDAFAKPTLPGDTDDETAFDDAFSSRWISGDESDWIRMTLPIALFRYCGLPYFIASKIVATIETLEKRDLLYLTAAIGARKVDIDPPAFARLSTPFQAVLLELPTTTLEDLAWGRRCLEDYIHRRIAASAPSSFAGDADDWSRLILTLTFLVSPGIGEWYDATEPLPSDSVRAATAAIDACKLPGNDFFNLSVRFSKLGPPLQRALIVGLGPRLARRRTNIDYFMRKAFADTGVSGEVLDRPRFTLQLAFCASPGAGSSIASTLAAIGNLSDDGAAYLTTALDVGAFDSSSLDFAKLSPEIQSTMVSFRAKTLANIARARKRIVDYILEKRARSMAEKTSDPKDDEREWAGAFPLSWRDAVPELYDPSASDNPNFVPDDEFFVEDGLLSRWVFADESDWERAILQIAFLYTTISCALEVVAEIETLPSDCILSLADAIDVETLDKASPNVAKMSPQLQTALLGLSSNDLHVLAPIRFSLFRELGTHFSVSVNPTGLTNMFGFSFLKTWIVQNEGRYIERILGCALSENELTYIRGAIEVAKFDESSPNFASLAPKVQKTLLNLSIKTLQEFTRRYTVLREKFGALIDPAMTNDLIFTSPSGDAGFWSRWIAGDESDWARMTLPTAFLRYCCFSDPSLGYSGLSYPAASKAGEAIQALPSGSILYVTAAIGSGKVDVDPTMFSQLHPELRTTLLSLSTKTLRDLAWGRRCIEDYIHKRVAATAPVGYSGDFADWARTILTLTFAATPGLREFHESPRTYDFWRVMYLTAAIDTGKFPGNRPDRLFSEESLELRLRTALLSAYGPALAKRRTSIDYFLRIAIADTEARAEPLNCSRLTLQLALFGIPGAGSSITATVTAIGNLSDDGVAYLTTALDAGGFDPSSGGFATLDPALRSTLVSLSGQTLASVARARKSIADTITREFAPRADDAIQKRRDE